MYNICNSVRQEKSNMIVRRFWVLISSKLCELCEPLMEERKSGGGGAKARSRGRELVRGIKRETVCGGCWIFKWWTRGEGTRATSANTGGAVASVGSWGSRGSCPLRAFRQQVAPTGRSAGSHCGFIVVCFGWNIWIARSHTHGDHTHLLVKLWNRIAHVLTTSSAILLITSPIRFFSDS